MLLAVLSISLGVATFLATQILNRSALAAMERSAEGMTGDADLVITNGEFGVDLDLLPAVRQTEGVKAATPLLFEHVRLRFEDGREQRTLLMGVDPKSEEEFRDYGGMMKGLQSTPADWLRIGLRAWMGAPAAGIGEGIQLGTDDKLPQFKILTPRGWKPVQPVLRVKLEGKATQLGGNVVFLVLEDALDLMGHEGPDGKPVRRVSQIQVRLRDTEERDAVMARLNAMLRTRGQATPPKIRNENLEDALSGVQIGLTVGASIALFVGMFLVYNTLAVTVAERRHDIGVLRSVGATRGQIRMLFASEAMILGVIGSAIGVLAGIGGARLALGVVSDVFQQQFAALEVDTLSVPTSMIVWGMVAGVGASVVSSLAPAIAAAREAPSDALRRVPAQPHAMRFWWPAILSAAFALIGIALVAFSTWLPRRWGSFSAIYFFLFAFVFATPFLARAGVWLLRPVALAFGVGGRIAIDDLSRSASRTGLTVGALALGVALFLNTTGTITSTQEPIFAWLRNTIRADLLITSGSAITGGSTHARMEEEVGRRLAALPTVKEVMPVRLEKINYQSRPDGPNGETFETQVALFALPTAMYLRHTQQNEAGPTYAALRKLADDAARHERRRGAIAASGAAIAPALGPDARYILVSENFAYQHGIRVGDEVELPTPAGRQRWTVLATLVDYSWNRGTLLVDWERFKDWFGDSRVDLFDIYVKPGVKAEACREELMRLVGREHGLVAMTRDEFNTHIMTIADRFYLLLYAIAAVVIIVAFLGVANTLAISVLLRRRELGLLRAVGATRWQIAWSIAAQALVLSLLGLVIGVPLGVGLLKFVLDVIIVEESGYFFALLFPTVMTLVVAAFTLAGAQVAAALPAARAAYLPVSEAVAYE
jgi:putative ABC transport system permease protein